MHQNKKVTQVAKNIWRVDRWTSSCEPKKSLFVQEPTETFETDPDFSCRENESGMLEFLIEGNPVLSETDTPFTQAFRIGSEDGIYGLGMHQQKELNRRKTVCQMIQKNGNITAVPFLTSNAGYAILFDTCSYMSIGIDKPCTAAYAEEYAPMQETPDQIHIFADDADTFTYYIILANSMEGQIAGYRALTGKSPMLAKWTYGFFQSREHYKTQDELLEIAGEFRKRHIPIDCIVQDWNYWGDYGWNAMVWDPKKYPDPKSMIEKIHQMDMKIMLSVWPSVGPKTEICRKLEQAGGLLEKPDREKETWGRVYDPLNPTAADIVWGEMDRQFFSAGVDAWWLDSTEPSYDIDCSLALLDCSPSYLGSNRRYLNHYAMSTARNIYTKQRSKSSEKRVYILTRSGYAGQQACAASTWTGDIRASWQVLKQQISSLLSFSVSGIPYSTTDIGAFFVTNSHYMEKGFPGGNENEEYRELYTRWFWFGAFSPLFRSHGTDTPREMWFFGEPGTEYYDAQMAASRMRYSLMPYLYAAAFDVYDQDKTLMRPLIMDFPKDQNLKNSSDSYLFGPDLLVHIITEYGQRSAQVYLPEGTEWVDFFSGTRYAGGQTVTVDAPLNRTPMFVKSGSILLMTEPAECTAQLDESHLKLRLFTGKDCTTSYYQDDGDNYSYENGNYMKIPFAWNESRRELTIGEPTGNTDGFSAEKAIEIYDGSQYLQTVNYTGQKITLSL